MFLRFRPAGAQDLEEMQCLVLDRAWYGAEERALLPALWRELIAGGAANAWVIEDRMAPLGERIVHFGITVFVTDEFAAEVADLPPVLGRQILTRWRQARSPLLTLPQIRAANSPSGAGLNMVYPWFGMSDWVLKTERGRPVRDQFLEACKLLCFGYRIKRYLSTANSQYERDWAVAVGADILTDYGLGDGGDAAGRRCWLTGVTRKQALAREGTVSAVIFDYHPPVFFFTPAEQELLLYALSGDTDEELAEQLAFATITIKKRWENIYKRVEAIEPSVFAFQAARNGGLKRGSEKKRHLLNYLRQHLEELRPLLPRD